MHLCLIIEYFHILGHNSRNSLNLSFAVTVIELFALSFVRRNKHCILLKRLENGVFYGSLKIYDRN